MKKTNNWLIILKSVGIVAGIMYLLNKRKSKKDENPPKNAPQLHLKNPGTQSEFLTSASESGLG